MNEATTLASRLDRLRAHGLAPATRRPSPTGAAAATRSVARTAALAGSLGGSVVDGVVVVDTAVTLPFDPATLGGLPLDMEPGQTLLCLDTETTGLGTASGTVVFLAGVGWWEGNTFRVRQLFLPDHPDEPRFLALLATLVPPDGCLVTYNGRSFDWPLLVTRFRLHRRAAPEHASHVDLLPVARQLWKHRLADARLRTVEAGVVGVRRYRDLPGELIPERYFRYLRTGRGELLREVAEHNRQDIVSLARLLIQMGTLLAPAAATRSTRSHPGDLHGLARAFARRGRHLEALACCETALSRLAETPVMTSLALATREQLEAERARLLGRVGRRQESAAAWQELALGGGPLSATAWIAVAKHAEHVDRDPARAYDAAQRAERIVSRRVHLLGAPDALALELPRRLARLRRRLAREAGRAA